MAKNTKTTSRKRRVRKNIARGCAHIHSTFNNTIVTITDESGNAVAWSSAGALGFKGSRKSTPYAAQMAGEAAGKAAIDNGMKQVSVNVKGPGPGREAAVRALQVAVLHRCIHKLRKREVGEIEVVGGEVGVMGVDAHEAVMYDSRIIYPAVDER